jgi:threonine dehydrogenase-like Zn-dependent dehydrogenase
MCRNGRYRERGIKELDGFGAELVTLEEDYAVPVDPALRTVGVLTETASVLAKAWEQIDRIRERACIPLKSVLVTGAGPIGMLAALQGVQRECSVHVLDRAEEGIKPELVSALGAEYHTGSIEDVCSSAEPDIVVECTGVAELIVDAMTNTAPGAIVCLTGVSPRRTLTVDVGALNIELALENDVIFGSVNANRRHFEQATRALGDADRDWLERLITRRVPLERWQEALEKGEDDVKTIVEFGREPVSPAPTVDPLPSDTYANMCSS